MENDFFNVNKCKTLSLTLKKNPTVFQYSINGEVLQRCPSIMDIGVLLDHKLNWNMHIKGCVSMASKVLGLIKCTVGYAAPGQSL